MSTSDLYILNQKSTTHLAEFQNGWGSAPRCWDYLAGKYLGQSGSAVMFGGDLTKRVWALARDERVSAEERLALMLTFDGAYIPIKHLEEAGVACEKFGEMCENGQTVNHWPAFGAALRKEASKKHSRHARGVCLSCTSVSDPWGHADETALAKAWSIFKS